MKFKVDKSLLPIKAHFFFFFAALGPLLPQMNVFGRQLGVSPAAMGMVTAVLPLLWAAAKPLFGYVVDFWPAHRKLVFMLLITIMTGSYCCLWFLPAPEPTENDRIIEYVYRLNDTINLKKYDNATSLDIEKYSCHWNCSEAGNFDVYLSNMTYVNTMYVDGNVSNTSCSLLHMDFSEVREEQVMCTPKLGCNLLCYEDDSLSLLLNRTKREVGNGTGNRIAVDIKERTLIHGDVKSKIAKMDNGTVEGKSEKEDNFYLTATFWAFVIFMCIGTVAFNVANCIGDAVCFDVLGPERASKYGSQRAWGTVGYGITALAGGWLVDAVSGDSFKDFTPAFVLALVATAVGPERASKYGSQRAWGTVGYGITALAGGWLVDAVSGDSFKDFTPAFVLALVATAVDLYSFECPERASKYGSQRAWGTVGYGITALAGGWLVDAVSGDSFKDFTPAFVLALAATAVDLYSCRALNLPSLSSPNDSGKALLDVLRIPRVLVFICFAIVAGTFDSFIIYYMFWFLEELAEVTGHTAKIKFIEGAVVAAQSLVGECLFFFFSGKIIKRWGYGTTLTVSLFCYGVRMALISIIQNPWHLIFIEGIAQGPTYALCYATIVGYAAHVAPAGYSATVQGIVAGMDDGVGFAVGSLIGGLLYSWMGGRGSFRVLAVTAGVAAALHAVLFAYITRGDNDQKDEATIQDEDEKMLPVEKYCVVYKETVVPLDGNAPSDR